MLSFYIFSFYDTNFLTRLCHHHYYCYYFYFNYYGYCLAGKTNFCPWAYADLTIISSQPVLSPPLTPPQTTVHRTPGVGSAVITPSDCTTATILSLLSPFYINRCITGVWSPSSVLCRTELDAPIFREQSYVLSKCLLYCENVETL